MMFEVFRSFFFVGILCFVFLIAVFLDAYGGVAGVLVWSMTMLALFWMTYGGFAEKLDEGEGDHV